MLKFCAISTSPYVLKTSNKRNRQKSSKTDTKTPVSPLSRLYSMPAKGGQGATLGPISINIASVLSL